MCYTFDSLFVTIQSDNLGDILDQDQTNDIFTIISYEPLSISFQDMIYYLLWSHCHLGTIGTVRETSYRYCASRQVLVKCIGIIAIMDHCTIFTSTDKAFFLDAHWSISIILKGYRYTYVADKRIDSFSMFCYHCRLGCNVVNFVYVNKRVVATSYDFTAETSVRTSNAFSWKTSVLLYLPLLL